jgi:hypothetical protein
MFKLFVILSFIYLSLVGYSLFFKYLILKNTNKTFYNLDIFYGLGFVIFIAIVINFFIPLIYLSFFLVVTGIVILFILKRNISFKCNLFSFSILLFFFIFISYKSPYNLAADTPFYHLQTIKWLSDSKISFGLANLEPRYGLNSIWHIMISLFNVKIFNVNPIYHFNLIIYAVTFNEIFSREVKNIKSLSFIYLYATLSFILIYAFFHPAHNGTIFNNLGSPEVDIVSMLFFILSGYIFLKINEDKNSNHLEILIILVIFCYLTKLSYALSVLFILFTVFTSVSLKNFFKQKLLYFAILINFFWIIRNLIISGCGIFPLNFTCLNFSWTYEKKELEIFSNLIKSFSRDTPLREKYYDFEHTLETFNWLGPWFETYFLQTAILIICSIISIFSLIFLVLYFFFKKNFILKKEFFLFLIICLLSICLWLQAPEIRFGYGYIVSISTLLATGVIYILINNQNFVKRYHLNLIIFIIYFAVFYKNLNNYRIISLDIEHKFNYENFSIVSKSNSYNFFQPPSGNNCAFFSQICVYQEGRYQASLKSNYLFFFKYK